VVGVPAVTHLLFWAAFGWTGHPRLGQALIVVCSPFHPAGSAVSPDPPASSTLPAPHRSAGGGLVSVRCQGSRPAPRGAAGLPGGWSFPKPPGGSEAARRLTDHVSCRWPHV